MTSETKDKINKIEQDEDSSWQVQSKPRRLGPQHSLSRQDLEEQKTKPLQADVIKKKVIRFTKEEIMTFRRPSTIISVMTDMLEVASIERLNPVCFERFEPEDVLKIWNADKGVNKESVNRAKGRGKTGKSNEDHADNDGDWTRSNQVNEQSSNKQNGLWDDAGTSATGESLDLSDFAAMALKFRSDFAEMKLSGEGTNSVNANNEDMMERLFREQQQDTLGDEDLGLYQGDDLLGVLEDEEEIIPDWAYPTSSSKQPDAKRSLLLETLNVKQQPVTQNHVTNVSVVANQSAPSVNLNRDIISNVTAEEWFYTDPQGNIQGPFSRENMRLWHESGYFRPDLPMKLRNWNTFYPFHNIFIELNDAFLKNAQEPGFRGLLSSLAQQQHQQIEQKQREQQALAEAQRQRQTLIEQQELQERQLIQQQLEHQRLQQQQALEQQEDLEKQRLQQQQQAIDQQKHIQQQQLLQRQQLLEEQNRQKAAPWVVKPQSQSNEITQSILAIQMQEQSEKSKQALEQKKGWSTSASPVKSNASLAEIQKQEESKRQIVESTVVTVVEASPQTASAMSFQLKSLLGVKSNASAPVNNASTNSNNSGGGAVAWAASITSSGGVEVASKKNISSLRDIMQEEQKVLGIDSSSSGGSASNVSNVRKPLSWAAKASSGVGSLPPSSSTTYVQPQNTTTATPPPAPVVTILTKPVVTAAPVPVKHVGETTKAAASNAKSSNSSNSEKSSFGGKEMSRDLAEWCSSQLKRINGSDDITLMQFCMSLQSAVEIREYLTEYLGSSPVVTNFATDFIKYKESGKLSTQTATTSNNVSSTVTGGGGDSMSSIKNTTGNTGFVSASKKKKTTTGK